MSKTSMIKTAMSTNAATKAPATPELTFATYPTPVGPFTVLADDHDVVHASGFTDDPARLAAMVDAPQPAPGGHPAIGDRVAAYFAGDLGAVAGQAIAYRSTGPFRIAAWDGMRAIEPGSTVSYTELAATAGNPNAVRAAGSACASNPIALFVPCHRVLRSDGSSHGFLYGLECKAGLLEHERRHAGVAG